VDEESDRGSRVRPSRLRIIVWVVVSIVAVWLIVTGVSGIIAKGG